VSYWRRLHWHHPDLHARLRRTVAPTVMPLELTDVVAHLRLDPGAEQGAEAPLLTGMLTAAVAHLQRHCSYAIMTQSWVLTLHGFPANYTGLDLPLPPFAALTSINVHGEPQDLGDFLVERDDRAPSTLYPVGDLWPYALRAPQAIEIEFSCGRDDPDAIDQDIKQALLMAIAAWYENRETLTQFTLTPLIELGWDALLVPYRQLGFA
jgi:uncharacterized phiE125 gp8 family phage protein